MQLATWFTPKVKTKTRGKGQSSVAAAAYRAGMELIDERTGKKFNYSKKPVISNDIIGFEKGIEADKAGITKLWNDVEKAEKKRNAIVCHEEIIPLCFKWTKAQRHSCAMEIGQAIHELTGAPVQVSCHPADKGKRNTHVHIQFATRKYDPEAKKWGKKIDLFSCKHTCWREQKDMRKLMADITNKHAQQNGNDWFVTGGKFKEFLGEDYIPSRRVGSIQNEGQAVYQDNQAYNQELAVLRSHLDERKRLDDEIANAMKRLAEVEADEAGKTEAQLEASASDKRNRDEADAQTVNDNEYRIKEVALEYSNWLKVKDTLEASLAHTEANIATWEDPTYKKNMIKLYGQEEYDEGLDQHKDFKAEDKEKLKDVKAKLKDRTYKVLYAEYQKRESARADTKQKLKGVIDLFGDPPVTDDEVKAVMARLTDKQLIEIAYNAPEPLNEFAFESNEEKIERVSAFIKKAIEDDGPILVNAPSTINGPHRETIDERSKRLAAEALGLDYIIK